MFDDIKKFIIVIIFLKLRKIVVKKEMINKETKLFIEQTTNNMLFYTPSRMRSPTIKKL